MGSGLFIIPRHNILVLFCPSLLLEVKAVVVEEEEGETAFDKLKQKIEALGINSDSCTPGVYDHLYCPKCRGGKSIHRSLSFHINRKWSYALWRCFNLQCGWAGKERNTEKYLYGLDDIAEADEIIIASRIILATDGDVPGQSLAEELARRLGRKDVGEYIGRREMRPTLSKMRMRYSSIWARML
ncbi:UNVERIFIED_CONTAM: hypothetical protein Slati_1961700 [Sesamum latifolium]|uniref:Toprim domain-containing protein n=1 Tax=Sesamum latifolium TaxID=2727402 RepID=A0AAW2WKM4_9LAMI